MFPFPIVAPSKITSISYRNTYPGTTTTSHSYSGCDLGAEESTRIIVVGTTAQSASAPTISSFVIAGVSATEIVTTTNAGGRTSIYAAKVSTGTTGTISYTTSANTQSIISVHAIYGFESVTPVLTDSGINASIDLSNNVLTDDILLGVGSCIDASGGTIWTGLTEDYDTIHLIGGRNLLVTSASLKATATESPRTMTCAMASANYRCAALAIWR